jgi:ubiquitin C
MHIYIRTVTTPVVEYSLEVEASSSIANVKARLHALSNIPIEQMRLVFNGENKQTLREIEVLTRRAERKRALVKYLESSRKSRRGSGGGDDDDDDESHSDSDYIEKIKLEADAAHRGARAIKSLLPTMTRQLEDECRLSDYNIQREGVITLLYRVRCG